MVDHSLLRTSSSANTTTVRSSVRRRLEALSGMMKLQSPSSGDLTPSEKQQMITWSLRRFNTSRFLSCDYKQWQRAHSRPVQVAQLWLIQRAIAFVRKVHYAVFEALPVVLCRAGQAVTTDQRRHSYSPGKKHKDRLARSRQQLEQVCARPSYTEHQCMSRSRRFTKEVGHFWANIWHGWGHCPPTSVGVRKLEWLPFCVVSKHPQCII